MSKVHRQEQRDRVTQKLRALGTVYEETGRDAANFIVSAVGFMGDALATLLWAALAAVVGGATFGVAGAAVGFVAVWIAVLAPSLGKFLLMLACSAIPGAVIALVLSGVIGGPFMGWWLIATVGVIAYLWAKTVTAPELPAPVEEPSPLGNARPASPSDIRQTDGIDYQ